MQAWQVQQRQLVVEFCVHVQKLLDDFVRRWDVWYANANVNAVQVPGGDLSATFTLVVANASGQFHTFLFLAANHIVYCGYSLLYLVG